jgi:glycine/D-amino acid oxidase-like deaminating enzyme
MASRPLCWTQTPLRGDAAPATAARHRYRQAYRFLPDGCVQIGSRSAITGADAENPKHLERLQQSLYRKLPALTGIDLDYSWWGWVDVSKDGTVKDFRASDSFSIPNGFEGHWDVVETTKKHFLVRHVK